MKTKRTEQELKCQISRALQDYLDATLSAVSCEDPYERELYLTMARASAEYATECTAQLKKITQARKKTDNLSDKKKKKSFKFRLPKFGKKS